jgi:transposase
VSGLTLAAVARRHDIVPQQIYTWRRQFGASAPAEVPTFLPVVMTGREEAASERCDGVAKRPRRGGQTERVEIGCANGRTLRVSSGLDAAALKALIRSVEDA